LNNFYLDTYGGYDFADILNGIRDMMQPPVYEDEEEKLIDDLYPNPDNMTYEELLELQNKMGYVNKGLTSEQINVYRC
jgi:hypothetical protein